MNDWVKFIFSMIIILTFTFVYIGINSLFEDNNLKINNNSDGTVDLEYGLISHMSFDVIYCTTDEYKKMFGNSYCGFSEEYSDNYGGLIKINDNWINQYWLEAYRLVQVN